MGREVRRVPPNWEHPTNDNGNLQPMFDDTFDKKFAKWLADFDRIRCGDLTDVEKKYYPQGLCQWLVDEGQPLDPAYYRPWKDEEATWYQVWETVTEGTPVTPPFATKEELVEHLVKHGDDWDQKRGDGGWNRKAAENFVQDEWAPSMIVTSSGVHTARDGFPK